LSCRGLCNRPITRPEESYGCLSVVSVVCFQVEVCATGWSLVQRSPMDVSVVSVVCCHVEVSATSWSFVQRSPMDVCLLSVLCVVR